MVTLLLKAPAARFVTLLGIVTLVIRVLANARDPILVTLLGIVTLVNRVP